MLRREWLLAGLLFGAAFAAGAQGITAVTRRTFMGGVIGVGFGAGGVGGVGGTIGVSPQVSAAAAALQPAAPVPPGSTVANPPAGPAARPIATARPQESPEARAARESAAQAAVLAFQQEQARKGLPSAQLALGRRHLTGDGVERNPVLARVWLEAAERNGMAEAREWLARIPGDARSRPLAGAAAAR